MKLTLAEWRRLKGFSQEEMANHCEVHVNTYRRWEEKPSMISIENASKLADFLAVEMGDIIFLP